MTNENLNRARMAKNDEFYTRYEDIEKEISAYTEYNPDVFRNKTILCPCDDPDKSSFTKYFMDNFNKFGLDKLISTCYAGPDEIRGRYFIMETDGMSMGSLNGNGDFRSDEITDFRDESDIIITNPPFSLFREFFAWEKEKEFLTVGSLNAATYLDIFPSFVNGDVWLGNGKRFDFIVSDENVSTMQNVRWFTNMMHVPGDSLPVLMTMEENIQNSRHDVIREKGYQKYDNYDAIDVPYIDAIPYDYDGMMGVPVTYLDFNFCGLFTIVGKPENLDRFNLKTKKYDTELTRQYGNLNRSAVLKTDAGLKKVFERIFIIKNENF